MRLSTLINELSECGLRFVSLDAATESGYLCSTDGPKLAITQEKIAGRTYRLFTFAHANKPAPFLRPALSVIEAWWQYKESK